jgi:hypothetical protein
MERHFPYPCGKGKQIAEWCEEFHEGEAASSIRNLKLPKGSEE